MKFSIKWKDDYFNRFFFFFNNTLFAKRSNMKLNVLYKRRIIRDIYYI